MTKKVKISKKKMGKLALIIVTILVIAILVPITLNMDKNTVCKKINIKITPETDLFFVDKKEVLETLKEVQDGMAIIGESKKNLNIHKMEKALMQNGYLEKVNVFQKLNGDLEVIAKQKIPVARIINQKKENYYLDANNKKIPFNNEYAPRLLVVSGYINEKYADSSAAKSPKLKEISKIVHYIIHNTLWKAQIEQIYVDKSGLIYLIPKIGNHTIVIGDATNLDEKFSKLIAFYKNGLGTFGWDKYKTIDLRFKNQIVAKRKE